MTRLRSCPRAAALVAFAAIIAAACGNDVASDSASMLIGRTFLSQSVTVNAAPRPLVSGTQIRLAFSNDHRITASAGCNILSGTVHIERDRLEVSDLGSTEMGCDTARQAQDEWLASLLGANPSYVIDHGALRLVTADTTVELTDREIADPDRPLVGTTWNVDGMIDGSTASSIPAGTSATIVFDDEHVKFTVSACNEGSATVKITPTTIDIGQLVVSDMACAGPGAQLEAAIVAVLAGKVDYVIEAAGLRLSRSNGKGLTLRAQA